MNPNGVQSVLLERRGTVAEVVLNRPARRNALTPELMDGLAEVFHELGASAGGVDAVLLRGAGQFFCSGLDVNQIEPANVPIKAWGAVHEALSAVQVPVVACLEGGAINAGAALVLACDLVVAGESAYLQIMEAAMGVDAPMNAAWLALRYPPLLGMQLALSCRPFTGADLLRLGVALDVLPDDSVLEHARHLAERIASYPDSAGRSTKQMLRRARGEVEGTASMLAMELARSGAVHPGDAS